MFIVAAPWSQKYSHPGLAIFKFPGSEIQKSGDPEEFVKYARSIDPSMDWKAYEVELKEL